MSYLRTKLPESLPAETVREMKVCTLEHLIMWLEKQPADEVYCWSDCGKCLYTQYGEAIGFGTGLEAYVRATDKISELYGLSFIKEPFEIAHALPWTYGAALERARSALREGGK